MKQGPERDALIADHYVRLRRLALRAKSRLPASIQVDDLIQEGALGLMWAAERYDLARGKFWTYARRVAYGWMIEANSRQHYKNAKHCELREAREKPAPHERQIAAVEQAIDHQRQAATLRRSLAVLPARTRRLVALYYFEEQTPATIAAGMDVTACRVRQIHREALTRLRREVEMRGLKRAA